MPTDNVEDIINDPIDPEDYKTGDIEADDLPQDDEDEDIVDIGDEEIDPIGDAALDDDEDLDDEEFDMELDNNNDDDDLPDAFTEEEPIDMVPPEEIVRWNPVPQENGDIWSEHTDGFVLRARPLSAQQDDKIKYVAQLYKNDKTIEKGVIYIDQNVDAQEYLQNIADRILDRLNLVNLSKQEAKPAIEDPEELNI